MAYCNNCGNPIDEGATFCPSCGTPVARQAEGAQAQQAPPQQQYQAPPQQQYQQAPPPPSQGPAFMNTPDTTASYSREDIEQNKVMAIFAYIWLLFLVPLLAAPNSRFARFHANQGLVLFIFEAGASVILVILGILFAFISPVLSFLSTILWLLVWLPSIGLIVLGIINASGGKAKELPLIGKIKLIK
ncbi:MAG: zinc-ribbon domain-containing protein [Clostridiaceae bacterium]|nr:zinc-ribbon domain-containing protein [Clostridiaceae bacterium]